MPRSQPTVGVKDNASRVRLSPFETMLITGSSGAGKSTVVTALLEQIHELGFQFCVVDPEGDYSEFPDAVVVGDARQEPRISELTRLLTKPEISVVANLLAIDPEERPRFLAKFLPEIAKLRSETGRPHWIVLDEAHHCLPAKWRPAPITLPAELSAAIAVTVHPDEVAREFLDLVSTVIGVGNGAVAAIEKFCKITARPIPGPPSPPIVAGSALILARGVLNQVTPTKPKERQKRHARKYAEGELGEDRSFYFQGPKGALNLRAHNLSTFLQLAEGVDDETWLFHLRSNDYSRWLRDAIKDDDLASEAFGVEADASLSAHESRLRIRNSLIAGTPHRPKQAIGPTDTVTRLDRGGRCSPRPTLAVHLFHRSSTLFSAATPPSSAVRGSITMILNSAQRPRRRPPGSELLSFPAGKHDGRDKGVLPLVGTAPPKLRCANKSQTFGGKSDYGANGYGIDGSR